MKKAATLMLFIMMMVVLVGCTEQANGLILYGEKDKFNTIITTYKNDIKSQDMFNIKKLEANGKEIIVLSESSARKLISMELWKEVENENKLSIVKAMPTIGNDEGFLFAKPEDQNVKVNGLTLKYQGNCVIGDTSAYTDALVVVKDSQFKFVKGTEKQMLVMYTDKNMDQEVKNMKSAEHFQLITMKKPN